MQASYVPRRSPEASDLEIRGLRHHVTRWPGTDPEPVFERLQQFLNCL